MIDRSKVWVYDIETYPNFFCLVAVNLGTGERLIFEISERVDHAQELWVWLWFLMHDEDTWFEFYIYIATL